MNKITFKLLLFLVASFSVQYCFSQQSLQMPSHSSMYSNGIRGYWFTAPVDFTIVGLRVPSEAGTGAQYIQVVKIHDNTPVVYPTTSTNFTSLAYIQGATNGVIQNVNISVTAGDKIAVFGEAGNNNTYGNVSSHTATIDGNAVSLARILYQGHIQTSGIPEYSTEPTGSSISRVELYYETCQTDITAHPQGKTICENDQTTFSITAVDVADYRWQVDEGSGFVDVTNNTIYSGATTRTLTVSNVPYLLNGYVFRCLAEKGSCSDTSLTATLNVNGLVKLANVAANDTACKHSDKDILINTQGSVTSYQWQIYSDAAGDYVDLPHQPPYSHFDDRLLIEKVPDTLNNSIFRLKVNGVCNNAVSGSTKLIVTNLPEVATPPEDKFARSGEEVIFEVTSTSPFNSKYQWQVAPASSNNFVNINDGGVYSGTRTPRLRVYGVSRVQDQFRFRCVIATGDACVAPKDTSNFALLSVEPPASVGNLPFDSYMAVYPNPANGSELFISFDQVEVQESRYILTDKMGRVVKTGSLNGQKTSVNISELPAGIYVADVVDSDNKVIARTKVVRL